MVEGDRKESSPRSSFRLYCLTKCCQNLESPERRQDQEENRGNILSSKTTQNKPGGWKSMPYILGNETFERLATFGLLANFLVYLMNVFHLEQVVAVNITNIWSGITNFAPLLGAFISDAYLGRFKTIAFASFASFLGMVNMTLTAWVPQLHPPKCNMGQQPFGQCRSANTTQLSVLLLALGLLSVGTGGIRPCSIHLVLISLIQPLKRDVKGSIAFTIGVYVHVKPEGSMLSGIVQVMVGAYKKRNLKLPEGDVDGLFYNSPSKVMVSSKLPLTNQFRFLNKAALIVENDELHPDGSPIDKWRLCSIQQVEGVNCLVKIIPIWITGIFAFISITQQSTFTVSQALQMDRHLDPKFEIPAASIGVISLLTIAIWAPV